MICAGMVTKLAATKEEQNVAVLKVIEMEGAVKCLSGQL
jgi:hypothetical protein